MNPRCFGLLVAVLAVGCAKEPEPRSVAEFMDNPHLLEAAVVRCAQNRTESRYDAECMNAREAVKIVEAREEATRRAEFERQSELKRQALRRTQQAAAEARRRTAERERLRREAEYLAQFGELPPTDAGDGDVSSNAPSAVLPEPAADPYTGADDAVDYGTAIDAPHAGEVRDAGTAQSASDGANAPVISIAPEEAPADLQAIREELQRRGDGSEGS